MANAGPFKVDSLQISSDDGATWHDVHPITITVDVNAAIRAMHVAAVEIERTFDAAARAFIKLAHTPYGGTPAGIVDPAGIIDAAATWRMALARKRLQASRGTVHVPARWRRPAPHHAVARKGVDRPIARHRPHRHRG